MKHTLLAALLLMGCGSDRAPSPTNEPADPLGGLARFSDAWILAHAPQYLESDRARREALEASLVNPRNLYARTRLGAYGRGRSGWDTLPVWNPRTLPIDAARASALARGEAIAIDDAVAPLWNGRRPTTTEEWVRLGARVFAELPLRSEPFWSAALRDPALGETLGIERAPDGSVPGLVLMRDTDGRTAVGITCALCHAARAAHGSEIIAGRARRRLDYGRARIAYYEARAEPIEARIRARWESWGPGRADVLEDVADVPIAIPDLWGLREQSLLTQAGTLRHTSPLALAIRQETQYILANHQHTRPPRELMFALTLYLYSLAPPPTPAVAVDARGHALFETHCERCHSNAVGSGDLVPIARIGTDPELATGSARGTGGYRPAPLIRVADAAPYLHHGAIPTLADLLSAERQTPGHRFGLELPPADRDALIAYVNSL